MLKVVKIFAINVFLTSFLLYGSSIEFCCFFYLVPCKRHKGAVSESLVLNHLFATLHRHCGCEGHVDHNVVCECTHHVCNSGCSWSPSFLYPGGPVALWSAIIAYELTYSLSFSQEVCIHVHIHFYCNIVAIKNPVVPQFLQWLDRSCACVCVAWAQQC